MVWAARLAAVLFALARAAAWARVELPMPDATEPIRITADAAHHWTQGAYGVWLLRGNVWLRQGATSAQSHEAVVWITRGDDGDEPAYRVLAYLEGTARLHFADSDSGAQMQTETWFGEFGSQHPAEISVPAPSTKAAVDSELYRRAVKRRDSRFRSPNVPAAVQQVQFAAPPSTSAPILVAQAPPEPAVPAPSSVTTIPPGTRRIIVSRRSTVPIQLRWFPSADRTQWIATVDSGVNVLVEGLPNVGVLDLSADRAVIWTAGLDEPDLAGQTLQRHDVPLEIYLEGNIVVREGDRIINAERMYYNVPNENGVVLQADILTPAPRYAGLLRLRSELVQITGRDRFVAKNSFFTSSRLAAPSYRLQASTINFEDHQRPIVNPLTGEPAVDPETGEPVIEHQRLLTSRNNLVFLGPVPVFYWPVMSTDLSEPSYYLKRLLYKNDRIFGNQILTTFDAYQLLGIRNKPAGTNWYFNADYLSKRGLGGGSAFKYNRPDFFGIQGPASGLLDGWMIDDHGHDNLGLGRLNLPLARNFRYRFLGRHRQQLPGDFQLTAEGGWISDINFLEQYYEKEFDEFKDESTDVELKRLRDNMSYSVTAAARLNPFFTETQWLPRFDHFLMGQSVLGDRLTWFEHSSAAYAQYRVIQPPSNPAVYPQFSLLPWETNAAGMAANVAGERLFTRQEIDAPLDLGPFKIVPYALGELGRWGQDLNGNAFNRAFGQIGLRGSIPFWNANPYIENALFNLHGLAHKVVLEVDASQTDASRSMNNLPLYDPLDDNNIEQFRRRFATNTFGGVVPLPYDPRFYALRTGLMSWVASPTPEIADSLSAVRFSAQQRLQTKRGLPGQRRIIDWMVFNAGAVYFPNASRDNFGQAIGLANYDYRWNLGDRTTILSDGIFDFFPQGQKIFTVGMFLTRPPRGTLYFGFRWLQGPVVPSAFTPFHSRVLTVSYNYQMSPKWVSSFGTSFDVGGNGNIGQNFALTRIGESFLTIVGFNVDSYKHNVGINLLVEPRFLPKSKMRGQLPVAGQYGLE